MVGVVGVATIDGGNDGQPDSVRAVPPGPDAFLRALRGGVVLGPPIPAEGGAAANESPRLPESSPLSNVGASQPDVARNADTPVPTEGTIEDVALTFFVCVGAPAGFDDGYCGRMANGQSVHNGAAACGYRFQLGDRFRIVGDSSARTYACEDRGLGADLWIDVWFYDYASGRAWRNQLPKYVTVEVLP